MIELTDEERAEHRKQRERLRAEFIEENSSAWFENGQKYRKARLGMGITLQEVSVLTGFSAGKLGSFERGNPVGTRQAVERSYRLALRVKQADGAQALNRLLSGE